MPASDASLLGGGADGNESLTTITGLVLIAGLAALGVTIVFIGGLLWEHLFLGLLLLGPVGLKLASAGYRFARYYAGSPAYVRKGAPWTPLRLIAPLVVASTVVVFLTGVVLLFAGPSGREPWLLAHKASFIVWIACTALHVLGHIPEMGHLLGVRSALIDLPGIRTDLEHRADPAGQRPGTVTAPAAALGQPGEAGRALAVAAAVVTGLILGLALIPEYHVWTAPGALLRLGH